MNVGEFETENSILALSRVIEKLEELLENGESKGFLNVIEEGYDYIS